MAYINGLLIWVKDEKVNYNVTVATHPVETGQEITDHVLKEPLELSITGKIVGDNSAEILEKIRKIQEEGKLCQYEGRNRAQNCQIVSFSTSADYAITGGFDFDMTLRQTRIASGATGNITALQSYKVPKETTWQDPTKTEEEEEEEGEGDDTEDGEDTEEESEKPKEGATNTKDETQAGLQQKDVNSVMDDIYHYVKKGETVYSIMKQYQSVGATIRAIANQIPGGAEFVEKGQKIRIAARL